jgi:hypothetical protein
MKAKNRIKNMVYILTISTIFILFTALSFIYVNEKAYTQNNVYDNNIPPSLEGLSLTDSLDIIQRKLKSHHIYDRYLNKINHMTVIDPYLLYSQRFFTQYYNDFIVTKLCNGEEYLVKFNDININNSSYHMYKKTDDDYNVIYNKLMSITLKDEETIRRFNPILDKQSGINIDLFNKIVYRITGNYNMDLDMLTLTIEEYNDIYGEHKVYTSGDNRIIRWQSKENIISLTLSTDTLERLSFVDLYRGEDAFYENQIKIQIFNSNINQEIIRYKSDIYMDVVRNLSFEYKNKVDSMNYYLCETY